MMENNGFASQYIAAMLIEWRAYLTYRLELMVAIIRRLLSPIGSIVLWSVIYAATGTHTLNGFPQSAIYIYFLAMSAVTASVLNVNIGFDMQSDIKSGDIAGKLVKPFSYPWLAFAVTLADSMFDFLILTVPIMIVASVAIGYHINPAFIGMFMLTMLLGFIISSLIFFTAGCLSAYLINIWGILSILQWGFAILGGRMIPLTVFPPAMQTIIQALPFYLVYYLPVATITGIATPAFIGAAMVEAVEWIIALSVIAYAAWGLSKNKIMAAGG